MAETPPDTTPTPRSLRLPTGSLLLALLIAFAPGLLAQQNDAPVRTQLQRAIGDAFTQSAHARSLNRGPGKTEGVSILLEAGAVLHDDVVRAQNGAVRNAALDMFDFVGAYGDIAHSDLNRALPSGSEIFARAQALRQQHRAVPIAIAALDYATWGERAAEIGRDDDGRVVLPATAPGVERFVAVGAMADMLPSWNPRIVFPSALVMRQGNDRITHLAVRVNGSSWQRTALDRVLTLDPATFRRTPRDGRQLVLDVSMRVNGERVRARTRLRWRQGPASQMIAQGDSPGGLHGLGSPSRDDRDDPRVSVLAPPDEGCPVTCYDMPQVTADFAWPPSNGQRGKINPRIYTSSGRVELENGRRVPKLRNVVIAVDGFDAFNTRTQEDVWSDFQRGFTEILEWGFDLVVVDYHNGRDYMQKNGYALRKLVTDVVPGWIDPAFEGQPLIVIGGSMGTQTTRWALRTAELGYPWGDPVDHNVGLWVAFDGPFHGANIAIGNQAIADFLKDESDLGVLFEQALNSPAARQQMPRTRLVGAKLPKKKDYRRGNPLLSWYVPDPLHTEYYDLVNQPWFRMPQQPRTASITSGSGTGTLQLEPPHPGWLPTSMLNRVFKDNIIGRVNIWAQTDHDNGHIFHGHIRKFLSWRTRDLYLGPADWLDVSPGDLRSTPQQIADAWNNTDGTLGTMEVPLPVHSFVGTNSALYTADPSPYYIAADDSGVDLAIPFDNFTWGKCNNGHANISGEALRFVKEEIFAFVEGRESMHPPRYSEPCNRPEPVDRCLPYVDWFADPNAPEDLIPWYDGANCYVTPVPSGERGFVAENSYWVEPRAGRCQVGIPRSQGGNPACFLGEAPRNMRAFLWHGSFYYDGWD